MNLADLFRTVKGYDCPAHATYLNSSFYVDETCREHIDSICMFEYDADYAMQRHSTGRYVSITKNTYFVIRYVATGMSVPSSSLWLC